MNKKRDVSIDTVCGIMILWMIFHHICIQTHFTPSIVYKLMNRFLFFFMPWFFFKSGMFFHNLPITEELKKSGKRILIPFVAFSMIGFLLKCIDDGYIDIKHFMYELFQNGAVNINIAMWYLFVLFLIRIINSLIKESTPIIMFVNMITCAIGGYVLCRVNYTTTYVLPAVLSGGFFFTMGRFMRKKQYRREVFYTAVVLYLTLIVFFFSPVNMRRNILTKGYYLVWLVSSLAGIVTVNNIFQRYSLQKLKLYIVGVKSMSFYVTHLILMWPITKVINYVGVDNVSLRVIIYIICLSLMLPIVSKILNHKKLKWIIGS